MSTFKQYCQYCKIVVRNSPQNLQMCFSGVKPLPERDWNGPYLQYMVWWRRRESREEWKNVTTRWWWHTIYDTDTFTAYEIKLQAINTFGYGPESPVVIGYSGEDRECRETHSCRPHPHTYKSCSNSTHSEQLFMVSVICTTFLFCGNTMNPNTKKA